VQHAARRWVPPLMLSVERCGFPGRREEQLREMLRFKDVYR
jgi:hypothetical protein